MTKKIHDVDINYINYGNSNGKNVVLLHGWGQNIEMMKPVGDGLKNDFNIIIIDLPGFGASTEPKETWTLYDYVDSIKTLLDILGINKPILIGHSFGGKISLLYASKYECLNLILFSSPFRPQIKKLSWKTKMLKKAKQIPGTETLAHFVKKHVGSTDYKNASTRMRDIMVLHVNLDITEDVKKIHIPTLILWGTNDLAVSCDEAYELEKLISSSGVVMYENCTHYAYLERLKQTINVLNNFLKE
ncbi:MAG: alpha/beta hydrolase [Bacilli bacterium]